MFCTNCGKELPDDATFCSYCGKQLSVVKADREQDQKSQPDYQNQGGQQFQNQNLNNTADTVSNWASKVQTTVEKKLGTEEPKNITHPYQTLGGWLALFTYGWAVSAIFILIYTISTVVKIASIKSYIGSFSGSVSTALTVFNIILLAYGGVNAFLCGKMFFMVQKRDTKFLRFYELVSIVILGIEIVAVIVAKAALGYYGSLVLSSFTSSIFGTVAGIVVLILYFVKSVRVRTYFGTDEYISKTLFIKNFFKAPEPAVPDQSKR